MNNLNGATQRARGVPIMKVHKRKIGLVRVLTVKDKELLESHGKSIESHFSDLSIITRCIPDQSKGIYDKESEKAAIRKVIDLGLKFEEEVGVRAIIVSCAADPGVVALKEQLNTPIIGAGSAVASLSLVYSNKVGVLGIGDRTPQTIKEILGSCLVAESKPYGVKTTLDLMKKEAKKNSLIATKQLKQRGAKVIALACTGFSSIGIAQELESEVGIPVLDPVLAAGLFAWYLAKKRFGV